jgi:hypothetical protein
VFSLFCDLLYLGGAEAEIWSRLALYTMVGGFIGAFTAVVLPGFVAHVNVALVVALWGVWGLLLGASLVAIAKVVFDRIESLKPAGELLGR